MDKRFAEVISQVNQQITEVRTEIAGIRSEMNQQITGVREEISEVRSEISKLNQNHINHLTHHEQ